MNISAMLSGGAMTDIAYASVKQSENKTQETVGAAMLSNALDVFEANGQALKSMMELSVDPTRGSNFDMSV